MKHLGPMLLCALLAVASQVRGAEDPPRSFDRCTEGICNQFPDAFVTGILIPVPNALPNPGKALTAKQKEYAKKAVAASKGGAGKYADFIRTAPGTRKQKLEAAAALAKANAVIKDLEAAVANTPVGDRTGKLKNKFGAAVKALQAIPPPTLQPPPPPKKR